MYNPLGVTVANATPEQIALSGAGVNRAVASDSSNYANRSSGLITDALVDAQRAENERRRNKALADMGALMGAGVGGALGGFGGAKAYSGLGGALMGRGQAPNGLISGALDLGSALREKDKLGNWLHGNPES